MTKNCRLHLLLPVAASLLMLPVAWAQPPGGYGGRDFGGRGFGGRSFGGYGDRGSYGERGRDDDRRREERRDDDRSRDGRDRDDRRRDERRDSSSAASSGSVQGFSSSEKELPKVPGFNVPLEVPGGDLQARYDRRVIDRVEKETLARYDKDKDGFLTYAEAEGNRWDPPVQESDLDKDGRLSRFELLERYAKKMNLPPKGSVVYNTASAASGSSGSSSRSTTGGGSSGGGDTSRVQEYAKGLLNRYDDNKSGVLERDEWKEMKDDYHSADTNKDNVITVDELTVKLSGFGSSSSTASSSGSGSSTSGGSSSGGSSSSSGGEQRRGWWNRDGNSSGGRPGGDSRGEGRDFRGGGDYRGAGDRGGDSRGGGRTATNDKKSYRALSPTERLPKGLPDWFARNDTNADGQVMMKEYMTSLTEQMAADFARYDLNSDGVITPEECLEVAEAEKLKGKK